MRRGLLVLEADPFLDNGRAGRLPVDTGLIPGKQNPLPTDAIAAPCANRVRFCAHNGAIATFAALLASAAMHRGANVAVAIHHRHLGEP